MVAELLFIHFALVGNSRQATQNVETLEVWRMDVTTSHGCELCSLFYNNQLTVIISGSYLLCAVVVIMNQNLKTSFVSQTADFGFDANTQVSALFASSIFS